MKRPLLLSLLLFVLGGVLQPAPAGSDSLAKQARNILKRFRHEPTVRQVHQAAIRYAMVHPDRLRSLLARARHAGWLPEFRFRYNRNTDDDRSTAFPTPTNPILTVRATDLDHRFEWRATWNLDELIFNKNELSVYREIKRLVNLREDVQKEITKLYFERRRLQVDLILQPPRTLLTRVRRMLRLQEVTADLDTLTGGYFSRRLRAAGRDPYK